MVKIAVLLFALAALQAGAQEQPSATLRLSLRTDSVPARSALFARVAEGVVVSQRPATMLSDTTAGSGRGSRRTHMIVGFAVGAALGWAGGRAIDHGQSHGCGGPEQSSSGRVCDYGSGYYEPVFAIVGGLIGLGVASLLPHD